MRASTSILVIACFLVGSVMAGCLNSSQTKQDSAGSHGVKRVRGMGGYTGDTYATSVDVNRTAPDNYDYSKAIVGDHGIPDGHAIRALHTGSHGMELVGYNPLVEGKDNTEYDSGFCAIDTWDDGVHYYASVTRFAGNGGADIVDMTDPAKLKVVSHIDSGMVNSDSQFTDDGNYLFLGAYTGVTGTEVNTPAGPVKVPRPGDVLRSVPVAGLYDLAADGVSVWDTHDKAHPKFMFFSETGTYHNLFTVTINNTYYLLQTYPSAGQKNIYKFDPTGGGKLIPVAGTKYMVHDMTVERHPITGDWILITGKGQGIVIYNMNDPEHPVERGTWAPESGKAGWHEQEVIPQLVDGHALVVVAGETGGGDTLPYTVVDISDVDNPITLGSWQIPGKPVSPNPNFYTLGPHEIYTWNGYVVTGNYHSGVWLFDVGTMEKAKAPVTLGYYLPHEEPAMYGAPQNPPFAFNPDTWGAYFDSRGYAVTADWGSGFYVLKFAATGTWMPPEPISHNNG